MFWEHWSALAGTLEPWDTGVLEHWYVGTPELLNTGILGGRDVGALVDLGWRPWLGSAWAGVLISAWAAGTSPGGVTAGPSLRLWIMDSA